MSEPFFDIELRVSQGGFDLDYRLATDERCVGVFGPSGAGKTTVIEHVAGWRRGARGKVRVGGRTVFDSGAGLDLSPRERGIGYVPQDILLFPHWNVIRNVTAGAERPGSSRSRPGSARIRVEHVLDALELTPLQERPVRKLSGGERHRVALARALCSQPDVLLLDEPLASLDARLRRSILTDLVRVREEFGLPMLLISHDATEVQVLCDLVQVIRGGSVEAEGKPSSVLGATAGEEAQVDFENVLRGQVQGITDHTARVGLEGGVELLVPRAGVEKGDRVAIGVRADDILLALVEPREVSARNVVPGVVTSVAEGRQSVTLVVVMGAARAEGAEVVVNVTEGTQTDLEFRPGQAVFLVIKSRALEVIASLPA